MFRIEISSLGPESDPSAPLWRRLVEGLECREDVFEDRAMHVDLALDRVQPMPEARGVAEGAPQLDERPHHEDVHGDRPLAM